jgi:mutator protein MutT
MRVQPCTLLFLRRNDEILLAMKKRGLGQGRFNGVGGKIEPGETVEQAMVRECQEEVEVTPTQFTQVARLDFLMDSNSAEPWRLDGHVFVATHWQGEPTETEEMAPQWFKLSDIPYDQMWEDDSLWLPQVLEGKLIQASFAFDSFETMVNSLVEVVEKL